MTNVPSIVKPKRVPREELHGKPGKEDPATVDSAGALVVAANREFFDQIANKYDRYESCATDVYLQNILEKDLDTIQARLSTLGRTPDCLDCGGGSGNLALKMLARGWTVTVVDVSGAMLALLSEKARSRGHSPRLVHSSIESFLREARQVFDVIAFTSVLHHLYSCTSVVRQAATMVRPGGFFYSNYDPVVPKRPSLTRAFDAMDILFAKVKFDVSDVIPGITRRLKKAFTRRDSNFRRRLVTAGDLAEYRAHAGVEDAEVVRILQLEGFGIIEHARYPAGRTKAIRFLNERFRLLEYFKVIAGRNHESIATTKASQTRTSPVAASQ